MLSFRDQIRARAAAVCAPESIEYRFARGVFWSAGGAVFTQGLSMVASFVTARLLGKTGVGEVGIVLSTLGALGIFAGFGLGLTSTKYVAELRNTNPDRAGRILGLSRLAALVSGAILSCCLFVTAEEIAAGMLRAPHLVTELRIGCLLLFLNALQEAQIGALSGFEAYKDIARIGLVRGVISFPVIIIAVTLYGVRGAIAANVVAAVIAYWLSVGALRRQCSRFGISVTAKGAKAELPVIGKFSVPALLGSVMVMPVLWLVNTILVSRADGYGELGLLTAANQWRAVLMFLPQAFLQVALPLMSVGAADENEEDDGYGKTFALTRSFTLLAVFPAAVLVMFASSLVMKLYGSQFIGGESVLIVVVSSVMIIAIGSGVGPAIQAKGRLWFGLIQNVSWGIVLLALSMFAAPLWGAIGVALSLSLSYGFLAIWSLFYLRRWVPAGTMSRTCGAMIFILTVTVTAIAMSPTTRLSTALPAFLITILFTVFVCVDVPVRGFVLTAVRHKWRRSS